MAGVVVDGVGPVLAADPVAAQPVAGLSGSRGGVPSGVVPAGSRARAEANLAALRLVGELSEQGRAASPAERVVLAGWTAWGALPEVFAEHRDVPAWAMRARDELRGLVGPSGYAAARRTVVNAHYTDPAYARVVWDAVTALGFTGGRVLEPGCGAGVFLGTVPAELDVSLVGVELDPASAAIAAALYPAAQIRTESFADTDLPDGGVDVVIGNVPFADVVLHDPVHNKAGHVLHNHVIVKALALTRPGGLVAVLTSRFTLDSVSTAARSEIAAAADLVGAVRLPTGAHRAVAGTDAVTDLVILRRREPGEPRDFAFSHGETEQLEGVGGPVSVVVGGLGDVLPAGGAGEADGLVAYTGHDAWRGAGADA